MTDNASTEAPGLAASLGLSEPALRLFITIMTGYPIALIHRLFLFGKPPPVQHVFFILCGLSLGMYNFGLEMLYTLLGLVVVYAILKMIGGTVHSVIITFVFTLGSLIAGYWVTTTDNYDIVWTMPYCILTLRLTGLAFDIYDGSLPEEQLSKDSKQLALREVPSLLEIAGFTYMPTSFMIGPQFPMRKYKDFVAGKLKPANQTIPQCVRPAMERLLLGLIYCFLYTAGSMYYSPSYLQSEKFREHHFFQKVFDIAIWAHVALYQYICCWLFTEGSCILIGLGYNGTDKEGMPKWNGCSNVDVVLFEKAQNFSHDYVASFNTNTNFWVLQYVYKRLKFLGNKNLSQLGVLLFLSIWHGLHSGYYVTFFTEFFAVYMEKDYFVILEENKKFLQFLNRPLVLPFKIVLLKLYTILFMGPCLLPLALLSFSKYWPIYKEIYCFHFVWLLWPLYRPLVVMLLPPAHQRTE
ncbi:lysophospholipid acyltransferase 5 [Cimex lectularius]|uniref:Lysophospholipid acyltransferase 5 n=1 Tax=Cimex lectularius TaxID=79782 RepID=A0A8I6S8Y2_CIMLE|nr:lysophospholipid acyltransferase 5 [Cimex lectularius]